MRHSTGTLFFRMLLTIVHAALNIAELCHDDCFRARGGVRAPQAPTSALCLCPEAPAPHTPVNRCDSNPDSAVPVAVLLWSGCCQYTSAAVPASPHPPVAINPTLLLLPAQALPGLAPPAPAQLPLLPAAAPASAPAPAAGPLHMLERMPLLPSGPAAAGVQLSQLPCVLSRPPAAATLARAVRWPDPLPAALPCWLEGWSLHMLTVSRAAAACMGAASAACSVFICWSAAMTPAPNTPLPGTCARF
jgi:hypothetical protein